MTPLNLRLYLAGMTPWSTKVLKHQRRVSLVEMRTLTAAGGLMPTGTASITMRTIFVRQFFSWSLDEKTEKSTSRTNFHQLTPCCWREVTQNKFRQTLAFDSGGCTGRLRGCRVLGGWHALRRGWVRLDAEMASEAGAFLVGGGPVHGFPKRRPSYSLCRTYCG